MAMDDDPVLDPTDSDAPAATFATIAGSVDAAGALTPEARADLERSIETAAQEVAAIDLGAARRRHAADFAAASVRYAAYRDDALTAMAAEVAAAGGEPDEIAVDPGNVGAALEAGLEVAWRPFDELLSPGQQAIVRQVEFLPAPDAHEATVVSRFSAKLQRRQYRWRCPCGARGNWQRTPARARNGASRHMGGNP